MMAKDMVIFFVIVEIGMMRRMTDWKREDGKKNQKSPIYKFIKRIFSISVSPDTWILNIILNNDGGTTKHNETMTKATELGKK